MNAWLTPDWPAPARVRALVTTRGTADVSAAGATAAGVTAAGVTAASVTAAGVTAAGVTAAGVTAAGVTAASATAAGVSAAGVTAAGVTAAGVTAAGVTAAGATAAGVTAAGGASGGSYACFNLGAHVGDEAAAVAANRARLRAHARLPAEPLWLSQVHGTQVADADAIPDTAGAPGMPPEADAAVARKPGAVLAILTADCLPVLLCDRQGSVVAVAHAGWRGLAAGVLESAVRAMAVPAAGIIAWLGPAIGPRAYEVGGDVVDAFVSRDPAAAQAFVPQAGGKFLADLYALARQRLAGAGVVMVSGGEACTYSEAARYFSYRRDGITGRMASLVWIEKD